MSSSLDLKLLTEAVNTVEDFYGLREDISRFDRYSFRVKQLDLKKEFTPVFLNILSRVEEQGVSDLEGKREVAQEIKSYLENLPQVKISLAFPPQGEFVKRIALDLGQTLEQKVILNVVVREELVAGAIIEYKGLVRDYTIRSSLKQALATALVNMGV